MITKFKPNSVAKFSFKITILGDLTGTGSCLDTMFSGKFTYVLSNRHPILFMSDIYNFLTHIPKIPLKKDTNNNNNWPFKE